MTTSLLNEADAPDGLRAMPADALPALAGQIREFLIDNVCRTGGHLGPNLGVVELTIALHRVFHSPRDMLLFDTGHQTYVHKILTGRGAAFNTLRTADGISGYPSRAESPHDHIENSHASTALSYADGLAKALVLRGEPHRHVVAVVGDGALTGGMCWEALNNLAAAPGHPVIIVLNDNGRSYSPTTGGLADHLTALRADRHTDIGGRGTARNVFTSMGLAYVGPVDGHDISATERALRSAAALRQPVLVHVVTTKGKDYEPAEQDEEDHMHSVGVLDPATGRPATSAGATWTSVFADEITAIGAERDDVVCLTAAMMHPTGLGPFAERFPDRVFDVGMAEQHAVTSAAGMAMGGLHPVVAIYSTFFNRAFDQVLMDVALHRLPVTFVLDRAGVTGPDGASHHGMWDASVLPVIPGLRLAAPRDPARLRELLREAVDTDTGPTVVRFPKSTVTQNVPTMNRVSSFDVLRAVPDAAALIVSVGHLANASLAAADELASHGVEVAVVDPRWISPLDPELVKFAARHPFVLAVEDTATTGALGSRLAHALTAMNATTRAATFALPDQFLPHASREQILRAHGLHPAGIATTVLKRLATVHDAESLG